MPKQDTEALKAQELESTQTHTEISIADIDCMEVSDCGHFFCFLMKDGTEEYQRISKAIQFRSDTLLIG